jgi:hypothetical protein
MVTMNFRILASLRQACDADPAKSTFEGRGSTDRTYNSLDCSCAGSIGCDPSWPCAPPARLLFGAAWPEIYLALMDDLFLAFLPLKKGI